MNALSKTASKFLHIFYLCTKLDQKTPDALYQSTYIKKATDISFLGTYRNMIFVRITSAKFRK